MMRTNYLRTPYDEVADALARALHGLNLRDPVFVCAALGIALLGVWLVEDIRHRLVATDVASLARRHAGLTGELARIAAFQKQVDELTLTARRLTELRQSGLARADQLRRIGNVFARHVRVDQMSDAASMLSVEGTTHSLTGLARTQTELARVAGVRDVRFGTAGNRRATHSGAVIRFTLKVMR